MLETFPWTEPTWVMVPVPPELVVEVKGYLMQLGFKDLVPLWEASLVEQHLRTLPDDARAVLLTVADAVLAHRLVDEADVASRLGLEVNQVHTLVAAVNDVRLDPSPGDMLQVRRARPRGATDADDGGEGGQLSRRVLHLPALLAGTVVEQADLHGLRPPR
jgi:hypothetical protein